MLKWKLQYFGHLMQRADSLEKNPDMEKVEDRRRKGRQRTRWLDGITDSMDMIWSWLKLIGYMFAKQFYWYKLLRAFQLSLCFLLGAY